MSSQMFVQYLQRPQRRLTPSRRPLCVTSARQWTFLWLLSEASPQATQVLTFQLRRSEYHCLLSSALCLTHGMIHVCVYLTTLWDFQARSAGSCFEARSLLSAYVRLEAVSYGIAHTQGKSIVHGCPLFLPEPFRSTSVLRLEKRTWWRYAGAGTAMNAGCWGVAAVSALFNHQNVADAARQVCKVTQFHSILSVSTQ